MEPDANSVTIPRSGAIDIARGLAVAGVVATHVSGSLVDLGITTAGDPFTQWVANLGLVRLPSLALLLGLFIPEGVLRRGTGGYLRHRLVWIGYLFVLWSGIYALATLAASVVTRQPSGAWLAWLTLWQPDGLWFLPYVLVSTVIVVLIAPWRGRVRATAALGISLVVTLAMWGRQIEFVGPVGLALLFFSVVGATIALTRAMCWLSQPHWAWAIVTVVSGGVFVLLLATTPHHPTQGADGVPLTVGLVSLAASAVGIVAVLGISQLLDGVPGVRVVLRRVGRSTLAIYVMNLLVLWLTNHLFGLWGVRDAPTRVFLQVGLGVAVPVVAVWLAPRLRLDWLFSPPSALLGASAAKPQRDTE